MTTAVHPPEEVLLGFARAVRAAGVAVTADRSQAYLRAVAEVGLDDANGVFHAGRATLCSSPDDLARHDLVHAAWFGGLRAGRKPVAHPVQVAAARVEGLEGGSGDGADDAPEDLAAVASRTEVLRHRDVATLSPQERRQLAELFTRLRPRAPRRLTSRRVPARRGEVDARRTLREMLRRLGEPGPVRHRGRATRPRRVVLLLDVSGSMAAYADTLLRLAHRFCHAGFPAEVFTVGTRLTHVTRPLAHRDADRALVLTGDVVPDWSGGTRLAEGVEVFLERWGRRGMARGAVVVIVSDGWERDRPEALGEQVRRLHSVAHRVIWANPHRGRPGYEPLQGGIVAVLPHIDDFVAGHSVAAFEELVEVVARA